MKKETTAKAPSIEEAVERAVRELGCSRAECEYEVLEEPKKKSLFSRQRTRIGSSSKISGGKAVSGRDPCSNGIRRGTDPG